jgi:uncharacterized membrane protein YbhN (UPF0104 family)|tara:strand:+ start:96 stop:1079 length:984 start_codon:yes stop_codon:yes gene_type:complete
MNDTLKKALKIIVPISIGVYLTWYFLSGLSEKDIRETKHAIAHANYFWAFLGLLVTFLSHFSRAYRSLFLFEPLGYKPKLKNVYHGVMAGYVINYTLPRSGEFARASLLSKYEKIPFEKGFGTIVVERVIDAMVFGLIFLITGLLRINSGDIDAITDPGESSSDWKIYALIAFLMFGSIGLFFYFKNKKFRRLVKEKFLGFYEGIKSVWTMKKKWAFIAHTFFIWGAYIVALWLFALSFPQTAGIGIDTVFGIFLVSAVAVGLLPGGIGAYPVWVTKVLAMDGVHFAALGVFAWGAQTLAIVVLGLLSLFLIQRQPKEESEQNEVDI